MLINKHVFLNDNDATDHTWWSMADKMADKMVGPSLPTQTYDYIHPTAFTMKEYFSVKF